jgi:hypothetical protein
MYGAVVGRCPAVVCAAPLALELLSSDFSAKKKNLLRRPSLHRLWTACLSPLQFPVAVWFPLQFGGAAGNDRVRETR